MWLGDRDEEKCFSTTIEIVSKILRTITYEIREKTRMSSLVSKGYIAVT